MRSSVRLAIFFLLTCLGVIPVTAFEYATRFLSSTDMVMIDAERDFRQELEISGSVQHDIGQRTVITADGFVQGVVETGMDFMVAEIIAGDLTRLAVSYSFLSSEQSGFLLEAGRLEFRDFSGLVLDGPADGIALGYRDDRSLLGFRLGSTALLLDGTSPYLKTSFESERSDALLGPSRLIALLNLEYRLSEEHRLLGALVGSIDREETSTYGTFDGDLLDSFSLGLGLEGDVAADLVYRLFLYGQQSAYYGGGDREYLFTRGLGLSAGGIIEASFKDGLGSKAASSLVWASGDGQHALFGDAGGGNSNQFAPVTVPDLGGIFPLELTNLLSATVRYSAAPFSEGRELRLFLQAAALMRPSAGSGTLRNIDTSAAGAGYLGTQIDLGATWYPLAGLEIGLEGGLFYPGDPSMADSLLGNRDPAIALSLRGCYRLGSGELPADEGKRNKTVIHVMNIENGTQE